MEGRRRGRGRRRGVGCVGDKRGALAKANLRPLSRGSDVAYLIFFSVLYLFMLCHHQLQLHLQHSAFSHRASVQILDPYSDSDPDPETDPQAHPVPSQICTLNYKLKSLKVLKAFGAKRQRRWQKVNTIKA